MPLKSIIYQDKNFQGHSQELIPGSYRMASLGIPNDSLSSLKVEKGLKVTLYEHDEFGGRSKTFTEDAAWVGDDFNDITSSIKVEELVPPPARSQKFEVPSTSEPGVEFTNTQTVETSYTFTPSGTWTPDTNNPSLSGCTAAGVNGFSPEIQQGILDFVPGGLGQYMKYPNNTPFALLAINKATGAVIAEVSQATTLSLKPGETLVFVLNDTWGGYSDNSGSITVNWSAASAPPKPTKEIEACQSIINELLNYKQRYWAIGLNGDTLQPDGFVKFFGDRNLPFEYFVQSQGVSRGDYSAYDKNIATLENYIKSL